MTNTIRRRALELGFDACRFTTAEPPATAVKFQQWLATRQHGEMAYLERNAHKRVNPQEVLAGARTILTLAVSYAERSDCSSSPHASGVASISTSPKGIVARYARHTDYHDILAGRLNELTQFVNGLGGSSTRSLWYVDTGPLLERDLAQRSGLGFMGKHTNLISRKLGNWILLGEILTTLPLAPDAAETNRCGTCARCIEACPTRAITAPFNLDARRCISYLTIELRGPIPLELRPAIGARIFGCDDCLAACPWNRFAQAGKLMQDHVRPDLATPDLVELLSMDETEFKRRFAHTPMLRTKRRGLLRNVCVALGNVGGAGELPALRRAGLDPEPLIAEHAQWAIHEIESRLRSV